MLCEHIKMSQSYFPVPWCLDIHLRVGNRKDIHAHKPPKRPHCLMEF